MSIRQGNNIIAGGGSEEDNLSITKNTSDKIQTIGVIDQNDSTSAIKVWTGELADLPATKDPMTLYNVTDDVDGGESVYTKTEVDTLLADKVRVSIFSTLYPVGAVYIGIQSTCPLAAIIPGSTWSKIEGRYLLASGTIAGTSETVAAGSTCSAGAPNITGEITAWAATSNPTANGAFQIRDTFTGHGWEGTSNYGKFFNFNASRSSSVYGNSSTIRPAGYAVNVWVRTA